VEIPLSLLAEDAFEDVHVDGPFGSSSELYLDYPVCMLVGGGIGITPFASVLDDLRCRLSSAEGCPNLRRVYFFWVSRDQGAFEWFNELIQELEVFVNTKAMRQMYGRDVIRFQVFLTGAHSGDDFRALPLLLAMNSAAMNSTAMNSAAMAGSAAAEGRRDSARSGGGASGGGSGSGRGGSGLLGTPREGGGAAGGAAAAAGEPVRWASAMDPITGLHTQTVLGRPVWPVIFDRVCKENPNTKVGVFFCGPRPLGADLKLQCRAFSALPGATTRFQFHKENF
jgi:hypothetical protein